MPDDPPRLKHNRELNFAYLKANKVFSRYPKITDQIETVPLDTTKLYPFAYNPSIIEYRGKFLMAYRYHPQPNPATKIGIWDGTTNITLEVPDAGSAEDPKLFVWADELFISFVASKWPEMAKSVVRYGRLDYGKLVDIVQPAHGMNDWSEMEKNWVFFECPTGKHQGKLFLIYRSGITQKVYVPDLVETLNGPKWPYGLIKGGTAPLLYEGNWLRFFHSTLDNEMNPQRRRYYMGAMLMQPEPPFDCVAVSKKPVLYGSEIDNLPKEQRPHHWKPQVVFPGGALEKDGGWWVSCGVNDSACVIVKVTPERLNF